MANSHSLQTTLDSHFDSVLDILLQQFATLFDKKKSTSVNICKIFVKSAKAALIEGANVYSFTLVKRCLLISRRKKK